MWLAMSILCAEQYFGFRARRTKKVLGGGWRQAGILAAAGLVALDKMIDRLQEDHDHIMQIAKGMLFFFLLYFCGIAIIF